jgi:hypothetical protein
MRLGIQILFIPLFILSILSKNPSRDANFFTGADALSAD